MGLTEVPGVGTRVRRIRDGLVGTVIREVRGRGGGPPAVLVAFDGHRSDSDWWIGHLELAPPDAVVDGLDAP